MGRSLAKEENKKKEERYPTSHEIWERLLKVPKFELNRAKY